MTSIDFFAIRRSLASLPSDHDASGEHRPTASEIFSPELHALALDPNTPIVVGARGTGKSFWAGVLEQNDTRAVAARAYPSLGLERLIVRAGYTGLSDGHSVTPKIIDARVPRGEESDKATDFWMAVILRAATSALNSNQSVGTVREFMDRYSDPEDWSIELKNIDDQLVKLGKTLLVTFDALDTISKEWKRSSLLIDGLFEVVWSLRARKCVRAKIFIRPEQLNDDSLKFVELPKLRSSRVELVWTQVDLYGLLFSRLLQTTDAESERHFRQLCIDVGVPLSLISSGNNHNLSLINDVKVQNQVMVRLAGPFMGKSKTKGGTYNWPYKHLSDSNGKVTPRSFITLFAAAAKFGQAPEGQVITPEGIRHGLREASKVRVDQLGVEYKWVKRALAPLAGLTVPCTFESISERWIESKTIPILLAASANPETGFLPPFPPKSKENQVTLLVLAMERIGLLSFRADQRIDIPDLFRVAALLLKRGGITPLKI